MFTRIVTIMKTLRNDKNALLEAKVKASDDYMKTEMVRQKLQDMITELVSSGDISDQGQLERFVADVPTAMLALKMIPYDIWKKMAGSNKKR